MLIFICCAGAWLILRASGGLCPMLALNLMLMLSVSIIKDDLSEKQSENDIFSGVTGADKEKLVADTLKDWFTIERLAGGLVKMNSSSDLFGKEMIWKMGEEWSMEMPIFGKMTVR